MMIMIKIHTEKIKPKIAIFLFFYSFSKIE